MSARKMRGMRAFAQVLSAGVLLAACGSAFAQPTSTNSISLQAKLTDVPDGTVNLAVRFYDALAGGAQIGSTINHNAVPVQGGIVSVPVSPVDVAVFNGSTRYMGLSVNGGPELTPRTLVTSVPYAMRASFADAAELNGPWVNLYWPGETPYLDFITTPNRDYDYRVSVQTPSDPRLVFSSDIQPETLVIRRNGYVGIGLALPSAALDIAGDLRVRDGASVGVLTIRGADVAERFDIANAEKGLKPQPGMIVSIDSKNPGKLRVSTTPYDKKVAGAISGAGGLSVGVVMGNENADPLIAGEHPVAMSGRVYVWCDAAFGSIAPGDRLTASSTPGHAMKAVDPTQCDGAVIGKAMTELTGGRGLVLVLVNLQ